MSCYTFEETGECRYGDECRFTHGEDDTRESRGPKSRGICYQFQDSGDCKYGSNCRFSHGDAAEGGDVGAPAGGGGGGFAPRPRRYNGGGSPGICYKFRDGGMDGCPFGDGCRFSHDLNGGGNGGGAGGDYSAPSGGGGGGGGKQVCFSFRDGRSCRFGDDCRFSHDLSGEAQQ